MHACVCMSSIGSTGEAAVQHGAKAHDEKKQKRERTARTHLPCASRRWRFPTPRPGTWSSRAPASGRTSRFREQLQRTRPERATRVSCCVLLCRRVTLRGRFLGVGVQQLVETRLQVVCPKKKSIVTTRPKSTPSIPRCLEGGGKRSIWQPPYPERSKPPKTRHEEKSFAAARQRRTWECCETVPRNCADLVFTRAYGRYHTPETNHLSSFNTF